MSNRKKSSDIGSTSTGLSQPIYDWLTSEEAVVVDKSKIPSPEKLRQITKEEEEELMNKKMKDESNRVAEKMITASLEKYINANRKDATFKGWISHLLPENVSIDHRILLENSDYIRLWNNSKQVKRYSLAEVSPQKRASGKARKQKRKTRKPKRAMRSQFPRRKTRHVRK
jgi:hypothetical protein